MCRIQNLVVDLQQEAPHGFAEQLKSDSNYEVNRTKKISYMGEPVGVISQRLKRTL